MNRRTFMAALVGTPAVAKAAPETISIPAPVRNEAYLLSHYDSLSGQSVWRLSQVIDDSHIHYCFDQVIGSELAASRIAEMKGVLRQASGYRVPEPRMLVRPSHLFGVAANGKVESAKWR